VRVEDVAALRPAPKIQKMQEHDSTQNTSVPRRQGSAEQHGKYHNIYSTQIIKHVAAGRVIPAGGLLEWTKRNAP
jgi:hypothetical protein